MCDIIEVKKVISFEDTSFFTLTYKEISELSFDKISEIQFEGIYYLLPKKN
ncbi:MAG: hypothetical protein N2053_10840 [Chitinispirillaceae bacterium]|nr:hypothetical protein [Chitinispirillaceae bacterium]